MSKKAPTSERTGGIIQTYKSSFATMYRLVDMMALAIGYLLALSLSGLNITSNNITVLFVGIICFFILAEALDLYRSWRTEPTIVLLKYAAVIWTFTGLSVILFAYLFPMAIQINQIVILIWIAICYPALCLWRLFFREFLFVLRRQGRNTRVAAIIGGTESGCKLAEQIKQNDHLGITLKGIFDDRAPSRLMIDIKEQVAGTIEDAINMAHEGKIDFIYIAMPMSAEDRITHILNRCADTTCSVYIIPNFFIYNLLHARWQTIGSIQTLSVYDTPFQGASNILKRAEDIVLGTLILLLIAVPMLFIAIGIKVTSKGPVIFKQNRYGLDGAKIKVYKFRSMTVQDNGATVKQASKDDARITPFGKFLRRTSLDELPQFINVLQGRMSIVGPRPHAVIHNEEYRTLIDGYMLRHKVKPGITGWAQINGFRGETETVDKMEKRVEYDLDYIHRWSVWLDIKIIIMTVFKGFLHKNAY